MSFCILVAVWAKTETPCASYIGDTTADRTDKLDFGCQFSGYNKLKGLSLLCKCLCKCVVFVTNRKSC